MSDLRGFLQELESSSQLIHVGEELSVEYEISSVLKAFDGGKVVYFDAVTGFSNSVVGGVCGTRERIYRAINAEPGEFHKRLDRAIKKPETAVVVSDGPVMEYLEKPQLSHIPILTHYAGDPAPYITSAVIHARTSDGDSQNASIHRLQVLDDDHLAIRIVPRHLYRLCQIATEEGKTSLDVSISLGLHPALLLAAASPAPYRTSEFDVANTLLRGTLKLIQCPHVDAYAPASAELVLEGRILLDREVLEGPFVDLTTTFDVQRNQRPIEIVGGMRRRDYLYQALLPAGTEHVLLMGMPQEVRVLEYTRNVNPTIKAVNMTVGGRGWLHCVVSFDKFSEGDGKNVLMAIFAANPSIKHAFVVDSDIDVYDMEQVEWALATRFRGDRDLLVIPNVRVSSLDPTSDQELGVGCKVGFDATRSLSKPKAKFEKATIPLSERVAKVLAKYGLDLG
ncbi:MAG: UbiD family decarboxylase [Candidatus Bathyarchaeota archaeon]|nr:UbiD family decarboxylase [Candidatus Bathyarchaeota archaeon]